MNNSDRIRPSLSKTPRRTFLKAAAAAGAVAGISGTAALQEESERTFELEGHIGAWHGTSPGEIADEDNPTLELEAGETYVVEWTNVDGLPHNFVVIDEQGDEIVRSVPIEKKGVTQTVEFEATEAMATYLCEFHPGTMRGGVAVAGEAPPEEAARDLEIPRGDSIGLETVAEELVSPLALETAEEDERRFVVDQPGQVYVHGEDGLEKAPFLDIGDRIVDLGVADLGGYDERGLLGLAFHPDFQENGRLFVRYSAPLDEGQQEFVGPPDRWASLDENDWSFDDFDHVEVLAEFGLDDEGNADPDSEEILLEMPSPQMNHNAGALAFGPDGHLYFGIGDGGDRDDTGMGHVDDWYDGNEGGNGQDTEDNLLGSLLRIDVDVDGGADDRPYGIPEDNPLVDREGHFDELYAWGFRNPYTLSFDSDGRLFVADAGQNLWEEVNLVENGGNYGWNVKEGTHCFSTENPVEIPEECPNSTPEDVRGGEPLADPVIEYRHRESTQAMIDGSVVIGGFVYEGDAIGPLQDRYVFGNWSGSGVRDPNGELFVATPREEGEAVEETPTPTPEQATPTPTPEATPTPTPEETPTPEATPTPTPEGTPANETATPTPTATPEGTPGETEAETIELGGEVGGWQGRAPDAIADETNPTLELEPGTTYVVEWENVDGAPHNFVVEDADGNDLVKTEVIDGQGATQTVEFEASESMAEYYCEVHPTSMRGDVELSGGESAAHMSHKSDELWPIEKLVIEGREDGELDEYVYALGRDADDELYVLTSESPIPAGTTGKVHRIVPPGQGEMADEGDESGGGEDDADGAGNETEDAGNETEVGGVETDGGGGETAEGDDETGDGTDY